RSLRGQLLQMNARALVAAVLGPHHREDAELGLGRLAPQRSDDPVVFLAGEAVAFEDLRRDGHRTAPSCASALTTDSKRTRPSALPSAGSQARSGCGIRPTTLRPSLQMPAM